MRMGDGFNCEQSCLLQRLDWCNVRHVHRLSLACQHVIIDNYISAAHAISLVIIGHTPASAEHQCMHQISCQSMPHSGTRGQGIVKVVYHLNIMNIWTKICANPSKRWTKVVDRPTDQHCHLQSHVTIIASFSAHHATLRLDKYELTFSGGGGDGYVTKARWLQSERPLFETTSTR